MDLDEYDAVRRRIEALLSGADPVAPVPACPGWRVRDVVAHLAGLCEDWVEGRLDGYASDAWTAGHLARFQRTGLSDVLEAWDEVAKRFAVLEDDPVLGPPARWTFGDAVIHEADLRGALAAERVPFDAVLIALKGSIARWRETLRAAEAPALLVDAPGARSWWLGTHDDPGAARVEVPAYELFRALAGRRSAQQVRAWSWSIDPGPFVAAGPPYPFRWAAAEVID